MEGMSRRQKIKQRRIEKKYSKLIDETIQRMGESRMCDLWVELDKLKEQMRLDFIKAGIPLEG